MAACSILAAPAGSVLRRAMTIFAICRATFAIRFSLFVVVMRTR